MKKIVIAALAALLALVGAPPSASPSDAHQPRIVNGTPAADGDYPWMAAFLFDGGQGCGGSVIDANWILTAAHCVADDRGQPSVTPAQASFVIDTTNWQNGSGQTLTAAQIVIHPQYDPVLTNHDIALVRTNEAAGVTPVTLAGAANADLNAPPTQARVIGYGTVGTGQNASANLLQVDVPVVSDADCRNAGYGQLVDDNMVCAGAPTNDQNNPGNDSCQGDSGGPLFADVGGTDVQFGVVSFGGICGVDSPGVYTQVTTYREWITGVTGGSIDGTTDPGPAGNQPTGAEADAARIFSGDGNDPVGNAIAVSQLIFQQDAVFGVLAASDVFPDALGGSALASYFGPMLFLNADGTLAAETLAEFRRTVPEGGTIYVLGGTAAVPEAAAQALRDVGFDVVRLGGATRFETALLVADEVVATVNDNTEPPFDSVIVAFGLNWPDAVTAGQLSAWFGIPVILTGTDELSGAADTYLQAYLPQNVYVMGGTGVISDDVVAEIEAITGATPTRLGGANRFQTGALTTLELRRLFPSSPDIFDFDGDPVTDPDVIVVHNLARDDAFAHTLAGSMIAGNFGALFASVRADGVVDSSVLDSICGVDLEVVVIGGADQVPDAAIAQVQAASAGTGCTAG